MDEDTLRKLRRYKAYLREEMDSIRGEISLRCDPTGKRRVEFRAYKSARNKLYSLFPELKPQKH